MEAISVLHIDGKEDTYRLFVNELNAEGLTDFDLARLREQFNLAVAKGLITKSEESNLGRLFQTAEAIRRLVKQRIVN